MPWGSWSIDETVFQEAQEGMEGMEGEAYEEGFEEALPEEEEAPM